jgi:hypothetical protein
MAYSTLYNVVGEACRKHYKQGSNFNENKFRSLRRWILVGVEEKHCGEACRKRYKYRINFNENKLRSLRRWILVGVEEKECPQVSLFKWEEKLCSDNSV